MWVESSAIVTRPIRSSTNCSRSLARSRAVGYDQGLERSRIDWCCGIHVLSENSTLQVALYPGVLIQCRFRSFTECSRVVVEEESFVLHKEVHDLSE